MMLNDFFLYFIMPILCVSLLLIFFRFIKGPDITDRIVALDLIITCGIGIIASYSIMTGQETFLDIAMIFALIAFLGTIAYSYYLIKKKRGD